MVFGRFWAKNGTGCSIRATAEDLGRGSLRSLRKQSNTVINGLVKGLLHLDDDRGGLC